jgi:REP element-mobilizing transposase RayT
MARRLRIQRPGALYHVINRGNYRRDLFETVGAAQAFEAALDEACRRHHWLIHAFAILRNHFHLALETPQPNLVEGMHWLQTTFATRFNRFRSERGHLFQGRYQALLIEDDAALVRVIDYIHLNPVRAGIVPAASLADFRWGSLSRLMRGSNKSWLSPTRLLQQRVLSDSSAGWNRYVEQLKLLAASPREQQRLGFDELSRGWAIGTTGWRAAVARDHVHLAATPDLPQAEIRDLREARWSLQLQQLLPLWGKNPEDLKCAPAGVVWKVELAARLRQEAGASYSWIARNLNTLRPASLRVAVFRSDNR